MFSNHWPHATGKTFRNEVVSHIQEIKGIPEMYNDMLYIPSALLQSVDLLRNNDILHIS